MFGYSHVCCHYLGLQIIAARETKLLHKTTPKLVRVPLFVKLFCPVILRQVRHDGMLICPAGDQLTSLVNELMSRIWQVSDKEGSLKRATITWLWVR